MCQKHGMASYVIKYKLQPNYECSSLALPAINVLRVMCSLTNA